MANKHKGEEPVGWVTVKGKHFPKWADGTIGWQDGQEEESKNSNKKKDVRENEYNFKKPVAELRQDMKAMATSGKYKTADQLEEAYVDYLSKMPQSKRNELARLSNTGGKGVDRVMAMAGNMAYNSSLPVRDRSFKKIQEQSQKLRDMAKSNMDQGASKPSSRNAKYDTSRAVNAKGTMTPKQLQIAERRRDNLWHKEDSSKLTMAEKKELKELEKSISEHYKAKKK